MYIWSPLYQHSIQSLGSIGVILSKGKITRAYGSDANSGSYRIGIQISSQKPKFVRLALTTNGQGELFIKNWVVEGIFYSDDRVNPEYIPKLKEFALKNKLKLYVVAKKFSNEHTRGNWEEYQFNKRTNLWDLTYKSIDHLSDFEYAINFFK